MRIAHVTDVYLPALGGIEMFVNDLAHRQAARGDQVSVMTFTARSRHRVDIESDGDVTVIRLPSLTAGVGLDLSGYDAIHAHVSAVSPLASTLASHASRTGVPTLVTVHSMWRGLGPLPAAAAATFGLRTAPVAWAAVSAIAAELVRRWIPGGNTVDILPNAVEVSARAATPLRAAGEPVRIVSTMRLYRLKRPVPLLRMMSRVRDSASQPVHLTLVGEGKRRPSVERAIKRHGLGSAVHLTGRVDRATVMDTLAASDIYVAPAPLESFGLAALEARGVGLPVVAMAAGGVGDFVTHGVGGLLARSDPDMVRLLRQLVDDPAQRLRMAEHNRLTPSNLTWPAMLVRADAGYHRASQLAASPSLRRRLGAGDPERSSP